MEAHELFTEMYHTYGTYVNNDKMVPSIVDGLLPVHRRLLTTLHLVARNKYVKTAKVLGECMGRFHPHSEPKSSAEWLVQNKLADGNGQWGTKLGVESIGCAAPRYTKIKASGFIEKLAFEYINYCEWVMGEVEEKEPANLPTMVPICLIGLYEINSIGFGIKTTMPTYCYKDLLQRTLFLVGKRRRLNISPTMEGCTILNSKTENEDFLTGKINSIKGTGTFKIDTLNKRVYVNGWNTRQTFQTLLKKIDSYKQWGLLSNNNITYIDESSDKKGTNIRFEVNRGRNIADYFDKICESVEECLKFENTYDLYCVGLDGVVIKPTIDDMLLHAYNHYCQVVLKYLNDTIQKIDDSINELNVLEKIKPHISAVCTKKISIDDMINELSKKSGVVDTTSIKNIVDKYKIRKMLTLSTDTNNLKNEILELKKHLNKFDDYIVSKYKELLN